MQIEPKDVIVLGSIRRGKKKFSNIQNETKISSEELNLILEELENKKFKKIFSINKNKIRKKLNLKLLKKVLMN